MDYDDKYLKALFQDVVDKFGEEGAEEFFTKVSEIERTQGPEAADALVKGAVNKVSTKVPKSVSELSKPDFYPITELKGDNRVTKNLNFTEKTHPGNMVGVEGDYTKKVAKRAADDAVEEGGDIAKKAKRAGIKQIAENANNTAVDKAFGSSMKKFGRKIPGIAGALIGPALTLAAGGSSADALASAFPDVDGVGEGSDEVEYPELSRAQFGKEDRYGVEDVKRRFGVLDDEQDEEELEDEEDNNSNLY